MPMNPSNPSWNTIAMLNVLTPKFDLSRFNGLKKTDS